MMKTHIRKFTLECKWESPDLKEEELIGKPIHIEVPKLKNVDAEIKQAIAFADRLLARSGGYERGKITTIVIYDAPMKQAYGIVSMNQNEETNQIYRHELSTSMQTLMWFLFQVPSLKLSESK